MTNTKILDGLYRTVGLMLFNPITGEARQYSDLSEDEQITYDACLGAANAIKASLPRVMSLDEVLTSYGRPIWFESHGTFMGKKGFWYLPFEVPTSFRIRFVPAMFEESTELSLGVYGTVFRFWTSEPTKEQMEAESWPNTAYSYHEKKTPDAQGD